MLSRLTELLVVDECREGSLVASVLQCNLLF